MPPKFDKSEVEIAQGTHDWVSVRSIETTQLEDSFALVNIGSSSTPSHS